MFEVLDKDIAFALKIADEVAIICSRAPDCFFGKKRNDKCPIDWRVYIFGSAFLREEIIEKQTSELNNCPILEIRKKMEYDSPLLFGKFKQICEDVEREYPHKLEAEAEKRLFFAKFLLGFLAIYSARGGYVPVITKDIFQKLAEEAKMDEKAFCHAIEDDLKNLNPKLYKILRQRMKNCDYEPSRKKMLFSLFRAILDGFRKERKELFNEVDRILKESTKKI